MSSPPDPSPGAVRAHLQRILASRAFLRTESLAKLLAFIVEEELAGRRGRLREQGIAEDVFDRRDFEPAADTIVRTQARRLRERLGEYYGNEGKNEPVRIVVEKGSYVPAFRRAANAGDDISESSVVVLPFLNLTGDPGEEYFSDGLTEEIIGELAKVRGLKVVARTSSFAFKSRADDVRTIGEQLKVANVLEGSVRRSGDRIRVTAQLVSARTGFHYWSENYERPITDVLELHDQIAAAIAAALTETRPVAPARRAQVSHEAHLLYLKGLQAYFKITSDGIPVAIECFKQAMAADPSYAPAPAYMAVTLSTLGWWGMAPADVVLNQARPLAEHARALDPALPEARVALAIIRFAYDHDLDGALADFDRLFDNAPGYAFGRLPQAYCLLAQRRYAEASEALRIASDLDPLSVVNIYNQGLVAFFEHRWDEAGKYSANAVAIAPQFAEGHLGVGVAAMEQGNFDIALPAIERAVAMNATIGREFLVICLSRMGRFEDAERELKALEAIGEQGYLAPHRLAVATTSFPDRSRALSYLERAAAARDPRLIWLASWPVFDSLHQEPRFRELCKTLGVAGYLPPSAG